MLQSRHPALLLYTYSAWPAPSQSRRRASQLHSLTSVLYCQYQSLSERPEAAAACRCVCACNERSAVPSVLADAYWTQ